MLIKVGFPEVRPICHSEGAVSQDNLMSGPVLLCVNKIVIRRRVKAFSLGKASVMVFRDGTIGVRTY